VQPEPGTGRVDLVAPAATAQPTSDRSASVATACVVRAWQIIWGWPGGRHARAGGGEERDGGGCTVAIRSPAR
jgi:hypothetical protein